MMPMNMEQKSLEILFLAVNFLFQKVYGLFMMPL